MMTRKDYVAVANILKEYKNEMTAEAHSNLVNDFADYMEKDNDRFQDMLFLKASGVEVLDIPYRQKPATSHVALA